MSKQKNRETLGVIYPIPKEILSRIFKIKNPIFIKYLAREIGKKSKTRLYDMDKIFFYETASNKKIMGVGEIKSIENLTMDEIPSKYFKNLILNKKELKIYSADREDKKATLFHLQRIKKFDKPLTLIKSITMAGGYLLKEHIIKE